MAKSVVLFGDADHGKSTLFGYLYAYSNKVDIDKLEKFYLREMGNSYNKNEFYVYLGTKECFERVEKIDSLTGERYFERQGRERPNSKTFHRFEINFGNDSYLSVFDTPGHDEFSDERDAAMFTAEQGIFCIQAGKAIKPDFNSDNKYNLILDSWLVIKENKSPNVFLTMMDLVDFSEEAYNNACAAIRKLNGCKNATIIPTCVFVSKRGFADNVQKASEKMEWYKGKTVLEFLKNL